MKIDNKKKRKSVEHVVYEFMMFRRTSSLLLQKIQDGLLKNIIIESFGIHSRNLFDFFYKRRVNRDDIVATDFLNKRAQFRSRRSKKRDLENVSRKANKQISHLTYSRNNYNIKTKGWNVLGIKQKMELTIKTFLECLNDQEKSWFEAEFKKYNIDPQSFP